MSQLLSKRLKTCEVNSCVDKKEDNEKNSLDRFGDDLTELVLSYLSFEDKFRFECVSKCFQKLVFIKQTEIDVSICGLNTTKNIKYLRSVLKKCRNAKTFVFTKVTNKKTLKLMEEHFRKLDVIRIGLNSKNIRDLEVILNSISPKVQEVFRSDLWTQSLSHRMFFAGNSENLMNLRSLSIEFLNKPKIIEELAITLEKRRHSLRNMFLVICDKLSSNQTEKLFENLSNYKELKSVGISYHWCNQSFIDQFRQYSQKASKNLKNIFFKVNSSNPNIYYSINGFKQLKTLEICCNQSFNNYLLVSEAPKDCPNILELSFKGEGIKLKDEFFNSLSDRQRKLRLIHCGNLDITDNTFESLTKLKDLRKIDFTSEEMNNFVGKKFWNLFISEPNFFDLLSKCQKLSYFRFKRNSNVYQLNDKELTELREGNIPIVRLWYPMIKK